MPALAAGTALGLELVDQIDDVEEAAAGAVADAGPRDGDGQMGLAGAGAADQDDVALRGRGTRRRRDRAPGVSLIGVPSKAKSPRSLASGSLAMVIWYLIERACFSAISAVEQVADDPLRLVLALHRGGDDLVVGGLHAEQLQPAHGLQDLRALHHMAS